MTRPWTTLATVPTPEGPLELRQRGDADFLIVIGGRVLMNSHARSSEEQLSRLALGALRTRAGARVLIGGLGMGFTLRAALDALPPDGRVTVAELNPVVVDWCRGPLGPPTARAVDDPRVRLEIVDVARLIADARPASLDAIILDLYEGPFDELQGRTDPFYSAGALARQRLALVPGGVLAVWAEAEDAPYAARLAAAGFEVTVHPIPSGAECHVVYLGRRLG